MASQSQLYQLYHLCRYYAQFYLQFLRCMLGFLVAFLALALSASVMAAGGENNAAAALLGRYAALGEQLRHNQFNRPISLESSETSDHLSGDIYAVVDYPFKAVNDGLNGPAHWCEVLMLHLNTKYCKLKADQTPATISMRIGKKYDQPIDDAYRVDFSYSVATSAPDYFDVRMTAAKGPLGTRDYRIRLESVALPGPGMHTFLHLTYSYGYGVIGGIAQRTYLSTIARDKVGFTKAGGKDDYVGGMRGVVERNTMRYYLAIDAYLAAAAAPPKDQLDLRLRNWFAATEKYPRQLHEIDSDTYMNMKRREYQRNLTAGN